jgi:hypothetical protein
MGGVMSHAFAMVDGEGDQFPLAPGCEQPQFLLSLIPDP